MNFKPVRDEASELPALKPRRKRRRLRTVAMLPTLLTLGNLFFGFLAIHFCMQEVNNAANLHLRSARLSAFIPTFLSLGSLTLLLSMLCDALDGRVARMTDKTSKFGEQLDSLADMVSFGLAPAFLMIVTVRRELLEWQAMPFGFDRFGQAALFIGGVYACCAALRLARFNVEAGLDEAAHHGFSGLPSPGAAGAVASLVFLHEHLDGPGGWQRTADFIATFLPLATVAASLLMVSRMPYPHAVSLLLRRRPFSHAVLAILLLPPILLYTQQGLAAAAWIFTLLGPIRYVIRLLGGEHRQSADSLEEPASTPLVKERKIP